MENIFFEAKSHHAGKGFKRLLSLREVACERSALQDHELSVQQVGRGERRNESGTRILIPRTAPLDQKGGQGKLQQTPISQPRWIGRPNTSAGRSP